METQMTRTLTGLGIALALTLSTHPVFLQHHPENGDAPGAYSDIMIAANEGKPEESAKMGKDEGTQAGTSQGSTSESTSEKVDQPGAEHPKQ
jgi:hypothetical protein